MARANSTRDVTFGGTDARRRARTMSRMAGFAGISAVSKSIERYLGYAFAAAQPIAGENTTAVLIRSDDLQLAATSLIQFPAISILLYRVDVTRTMRSALMGRAAEEGRAYLPLDLHYLITAWADNAEYEHLVIGRALQALESLGALTGPALDGSGGFDPQESVALVMEELSTDDLMRIFEALQIDFRLSVPYLARVLVVAGDNEAPPPRTTTVLTGVT